MNLVYFRPVDYQFSGSSELKRDNKIIFRCAKMVDVFMAYFMVLASVFIFVRTLNTA